MIVVDASAAVEQLARSRVAEKIDRIVDEYGPALVPGHFEVECVSGLARYRRRRGMTAAAFEAAVPVLESYPATRIPLATLLGTRLVEWLGPLSAYDAFYAVLAEIHDVPVITCDARLAQALGPRALFVPPTAL